MPKGTGERLNVPEPRRSPNVATGQISFKQQSFGVLDPIARNLPENGPPNRTGEPTFERPPAETHHVTYTLKARDLSMVNDNGEHVVAPGEYSFLAMYATSWQLG